MENSKEFREWGYKFIDYLADYFDTIEELPVKSKAKPGDIKAKFKEAAPKSAIPIADSLKDAQK